MIESIRPQGVNSSGPLTAKFDRSGNVLENENSSKKITALTNHYYKKEMNKLWGFAELVALFEAFTGITLGFLMPSAATWTNALTSCGEYGQVQIARTKILGDTTEPSENASPEEIKKAEKRIEDAEARREGAMAWMQLGAGALGAVSNVLDFVKKGEVDVKELSPLKKTGLSLASAVCAASMFSGWGEKSLMAAISKDGPESDNINMNGHSDFRCFLEWTAMTTYPWVRGFDIARKTLDYLIPYLAIREGLRHLIKEGICKIVNADVRKFEDLFGKKITTVLKAIFFLNKSKAKIKNEVAINQKESVLDNWYSIPKLFYSKWFLGKEEGSGFRSKVLLRILRFFGCNPPECYLDDGKLVVRYETGTSNNSSNCTVNATFQPAVNGKKVELRTSANSSVSVLQPAVM